MANHTINVYLGEELASRVDAAKKAGTLDPKVVVKAALVNALAGGTEAELGLLVAQFQEAWTTIVVALGVDKSLKGEDSIKAITNAIEELKFPPIQVDGDDAGGQLYADEPAQAGTSLRPQTTFDTVWIENFAEVNARIQLITDQGGWVQSLAVEDDKYLLLVAWPEDPA